MSELTLVRHWMTRHDKRADDDNIDQQIETCHPDIPTDHDVLAKLRSRLQDHMTPAGTPIRWHHRSGNAWAAVTDLHQAGRHNDALGLAQLLHWCDTNWPHGLGEGTAYIWSLLPADGGKT